MHLLEVLRQLALPGGKHRQQRGSQVALQVARVARALGAAVHHHAVWHKLQRLHIQPARGTNAGERVGEGWVFLR